MGKTMLWAIGFYHWISGSFHGGDHPHVQYPRIGGMEHLQASLYFWFQKTCSCRLRVSWFFFNRNHFEWEKPAFSRGGTFNCQVKVCSVRNGCGSCCGAYRDYPLANVYHSNYTQVLWRQHEISVVKPIFVQLQLPPMSGDIRDDLWWFMMIYDDLWWFIYGPFMESATETMFACHACRARHPCRHRSPNYWPHHYGKKWFGLIRKISVIIHELCQSVLWHCSSLVNCYSHIDPQDHPSTQDLKTRWAQVVALRQWWLMRSCCAQLVVVVFFF